ncbi:MAG: adenylate kinase [Pseudomonadota bacterium]
MKRINVIGTTGSGKTHFSRALATRLDCPCIEMDQLFWKPGWTPSSDDVFFSALKRAIAGDRWVLDGNYSRTQDIKWDRADTIVWLDFGFLRTLLQLIRRTFARARSQEEIWPGTGNTETFAKALLSRDSILLWCVRNHARNRRRYAALMVSSDYPGVDRVRLRTSAEVRAFLASAGARGETT